MTQGAPRDQGNVINGQVSTPATPLMPDFTVPAPGRRYLALQGLEKDALPADRESADGLRAAFPRIGAAVTENRRLVGRVVSFLSGELGVRQFLDVGAGMPESPAVHEIAQWIAAESRVVYVDNDPVAMTHCRARHHSDSRGATAYVDADLRDPESILAAAPVQGMVDSGRPVALLLFAVLHFLRDTDDPYACVDTLVRALPAGSYVALSHVTFDPPLPADVAANLTALTNADSGHGPFCARTRSGVTHFLHGLQILDPGVVLSVQWRPELDPRPQASEADAAFYAAVARRA